MYFGQAAIDSPFFANWNPAWLGGTEEGLVASK
jgi:hypothetical protein